jgi:hypothetical protein
MEPSAFQTVLTAIQTGAIANINTILPTAGAIFALTFGISFIPKILKKFKGV